MTIPQIIILVCSLLTMLCAVITCLFPTVKAVRPLSCALFFSSLTVIAQLLAHGSVK